MKTIKPGTPQPLPTPPWWIGREVTCDKCGGHFVLEQGDNVTSIAESSDAGRHAELICPTPECRTILWVKVMPQPKPPIHGETIDK